MRSKPATSANGESLRLSSKKAWKHFFHCLLKLAAGATARKDSRSRSSRDIPSHALTARPACEESCYRLAESSACSPSARNYLLFQTSKLPISECLPMRKISVLCVHFLKPDSTSEFAAAVLMASKVSSNKTARRASSFLSFASSV